jgi:hypothetical protein
MSYTLNPSNKKSKPISFGAFSWPILLQETGMGYVLGYGKSKDPAGYVYQSGNHGSPVSNDGYRVTAEDAKMMARIARGYVSVKEFVNKQWETLSIEEKERAKEITHNGKPIYTPETSQQWLSKLIEFAEFAEKSKGFKIT